MPTVEDQTSQNTKPFWATTAEVGDLICGTVKGALSWVGRGVDERKDIQSLTCHHKLSTTHLAIGLRPFYLFLFLTPSLRININCNALYSCICIGRASQKKLQNPKRMPITNYFILFELCNSLVQAVLITFVWTGRKLEWMKWQTGSLCCQSRIVRIVEIWTHYPAGCLQGTFKIWQKGNSWFNFGRVVKTVKRICPTSIKRGDRLVGLPTCFKRHLPLSDISADVNQSNCSMFMARGHRLKKVPSIVFLKPPKWVNIMCV